MGQAASNPSELIAVVVAAVAVFVTLRFVDNNNRTELPATQCESGREEEEEGRETGTAPPDQEPPPSDSTRHHLPPESAPSAAAAAGCAGPGPRPQSNSLMGSIIDHSVALLRPSISSSRAPSPQQFGVPLGRVLPQTQISRGSQSIVVPDLLIRLEDCFLKLDGLTATGVFRLPSNSRQLKAAKACIDAGISSPMAFGEILDVHVAAGLIKLFFRELPTRVLEGVQLSDIETVETGAAAWRVVNECGKVSRGSRDCLVFLSALCARVVASREQTRMSASALGTVLAPNLFANPVLGKAGRAGMVAFFRRIARFTELLVSHHGSDGELVDELLELGDEKEARITDCSAEGQEGRPET